MRRVIELVVLAGSTVALVASVGSGPEPGLELTITSPTPGRAFDAVPITIQFTLENNDEGVTISDSGDTPGLEVYIPAGATEGEIVFPPGEDSGTRTLGINGDDFHWDEASVDVAWTAPWEPRLAICNAAGACAVYDGAEELTGTAYLGVSMRWDTARLAGVELLLDGVAVDDQDPSLELVTFSVALVANGTHEIALTAERNDGEMVTVEESIEVNN